MINSRFDSENQKRRSKVKYLFEVFELLEAANEISVTTSLHMIMQPDWQPEN